MSSKKILEYLEIFNNFASLMAKDKQKVRDAVMIQISEHITKRNMARVKPFEEIFKKAKFLNGMTKEDKK